MATLVQSTFASQVQATSNASISQHFASNTTAGNFLIAAVRGASSNGVSSPSMSTAGITWTAIGLVDFTASDACYFAFYYCPNAASVSSATNSSFTATISGNNAVGFTLYEFSGMGPTATFDTKVSNHATSNTPNPGSITVAGPGELIIAAFVASYTTGSGGSNPSINASFTAGQAFTPSVFSDIQTNQISLGNDEYLLSSASGANATTYGSGTNLSFWGAIAAAFIGVSVPTVTTQAPTNITSYTATGNGNITGLGGEPNCTAEGFVYGTSSQSLPGNVAPGASGYTSFVTQSGTFGTGAFTETMTGLTQSTVYYCRAWAQNAVGYSYGGEVSFTSGLPVTLKFSGFVW